jgi:single-stranded-DNA-specific exonuclease
VPEARFELTPYDFAAAQRLERELGVSHTLAQILVRRDLADPAAARAFLAADVRHPLSAFGGLAEAAEIVRDHIGRGSRITVHGDYDVDGVASTAILVRALRTLGARVDWYLPSRTEDGYGLSRATIDRLAARGTELLLTADCAITAVDEVAAARAAGLDVVVTDHHAPRADGALPDAPIVHPRLNGNPCPDLCAAGVAYKLAGALLEAAGQDPALADEDLDLVALATVADVVPLLDENRALVRAGLQALRRTRKPGLRALMAVAGVDPSAVDATAIGFRLAPRINASGRIARADAGLELLLTPDEDRARAVAEELDHLNQQRRDVETRMLFEAEAQVREQSDQIAYVLAHEGWHPGVIGIVAARIAERHCRPTVMIALNGDEGTGSARSVPAFDLLAGLEASRRHLLRYGGHRAAAGCTIAASSVDDFRQAFCAHAADALREEDLLPVERLDAVVAGDALGMGLAEELQGLEPFGCANPAVTLMVPAAECSDGRAMGEGERHVRFRLGSARAVRFGEGVSLPRGCVDAAVRLEVNAWNGTVEPRVLMRRARRCEAGIERVGEPATFRDGVLAEFSAPNASGLTSEVSIGALEREVRDVRGLGIAGTIADLVATGDRVLVVCAHAEQRASALAGRVGGFALTTWPQAPSLSERFEHIVALDPSPFGAETTLAGAGTTHLAYGPPELRFALTIHEWEYTLLDPLRALYLALRRGPAAGEAAEALLRGDGRQPRTPAFAGRLLRVLRELDLVAFDAQSFSLAAEPPKKVAPEQSPAYVAYRRLLEEGRACLTSALPKAA